MKNIKKDAPESANIQFHSITPELPEQGLNAVQPYKLNVMMKHASKIINQLVSIPNWLVSYDDIEFILEIVTNAIKKARANNE
jgi:hypothetical protein